MSVSERLKEFVFLSKKSATQLAKELGVTQSAFNKAIKGDVMPSSKILTPLANMGININWLLVGEGDMWIKGKNKNKQIGGNKDTNDDSSKIQKLTTEIKYLKKEVKVLEASNTTLSNQIKDKDMIISLLQNK